MEPKELSPALLHPPVTVVATLGEVLAILPSWEEMLLIVFPKCLHRDLEEFTKELQGTLHRTDDTWRRRTVTSGDGDDPVTSLSRALAASKITPGTTWDRVTMAASKWSGSAAELVDSWARLARAATELHDTCRDLATEAANMAATATARARELQEEAARYGTAEEHRVELGQALGGEERAKGVARHEAWVRREAMVAASGATRATMVRQQLEEALGLLEHLGAACDEATAFPRELQRRVGDIKAALKGTKKKSPDVPEEVVAKMAVAERLWEANARLARGHLLGAVDDIMVRFFSKGGQASPSARGVAKRCLRATEDIPRLLRLPERPQSVPEMSPVSMEPQELSPALLQPQVTVVAILGELVATLPTWEEETLLESPEHLHRDLEEFTKELWGTLYCTDDTWRRHITSRDDDDPVSFLSRALAASKITLGTTWDRVTVPASKGQFSVCVLLFRWTKLVRKATELRDTCREVATKAADREATATARARELQAEAARYGTAEEHSVELGQALGGEEGSEVVAGHEAQVRREAREAASEARTATMKKQWADAALGLLERLVAACDEATAFPRELQRLLEDTEATLEGTKKKSPHVPKELVAKTERLWEASARLVKDHLLGAVDDIIVRFSSKGALASPSVSEVAERCQRAIEDIPRLLQPLESPHSVPEVSPVSMEPKELSPALLHPPVTAVAILGELLATRPTWDEETLLESPETSLYRDLEKFTRELRGTLHRTDDTWRHCNVTSKGENILVSLSRALAAYKSTPETTRDDVTVVAHKWQRSVAVLVDSWTWLARAATELRGTCRRVAAFGVRARELQAEAAHYGTAQKHRVGLPKALDWEEGAEMMARHEAWVRREAREAASEAIRATMVRQWADAALGPLQRLVAACDEATAFPRELQRLLRDTEAALKGTKKSPDVPEELVAKAAEAERLWEASARLARGHLLGAVDDIIVRFSSKLGSARPSAFEVAQRCQRAIEDIPNLLQGR